MSPQIGELFAGYGGLGMAVQQVYGGALAWYSEFDAAPSKIMAQHHPGVPNHGDITAIRWADVEPVDVLTGGFPCQDVSAAGRRAGMTEGTRSGLWSYMRAAIDQLRPELVVVENVGGLFSAQANSFVEPCPYGLGDAGGGGHAVFLRAADAVLGDLASIGYDAEWVALRASDVGAPHGRLRVFITAHPQGEPGRLAHGDRGDAAGADRSRLERVGWVEPAALTLLPTPRTTDMNGPGVHGTGGMDLRTAVTLLPTPTTLDSREARTTYAGGGLTLQGAFGSVSETDAARHRRAGRAVNDHGKPLAIEALRREHEQWGEYAPVIHRWEQVMGRPAPAPTGPGKNRPRLSARFVEWMMGLPDGHVTGVGLTRRQQLKALGNGVVPQQGAAALAHLHHVRKAA